MNILGYNQRLQTNTMLEDDNVITILGCNGWVSVRYVLDVMVVGKVPILTGIPMGSSHPMSQFCTIVVLILVVPNPLCPLIIVGGS